MSYRKTDPHLMSGMDLLFIIGISLYLVSLLFDLTVIGHGIANGLLFKVLRYFSYVLLLVKMTLCLLFKRKFIVLFALASMIVSMSAFISSDKKFVFYILIFGAAYGISSRVLLKVYFCVQTGFIILIILLSQLGIIKDYVWDIGTRNRHMLGFNWTTTAPILFLFITITYIAIKKGRIGIIELGIFFPASYWLYSKSNTRLAFILNVLILLFFFLAGKKIEYRERMPRLAQTVFILSPYLICLFTYAMYMLYNPENAFMSKVNSLLSNRLDLGMNALHTYGISLFGTEVVWKGWSVFSDNSVIYNYVDCSYLQIGIQYGVSCLFIILFLFSCSIYFSIKRRQYYMCWILLFILLFAINEPQLMNLSFDVFPLLVVTDWCTSDDIFTERNACGFELRRASI